MSADSPRTVAVDGCPVCGGRSSRPRLESGDLLLGVRGRFRYEECVACRTVYQNPRVIDEDLPLCYFGDYNTRAPDGPWTPTPAPASSMRARLRDAIRWASDGHAAQPVALPWRIAGRLAALHPGLRRRARLGLVDGLEPPAGGHGRCLEVGPGKGVDLLGLRTLGWQACGLEADAVAAGVASRTSGCEVRVGTLSTSDYPPASFDLVYLSHVFEHLPDPVAALARCRELLVPGGRLVLICPNPGALTVRLYGVLSLVWDPPRHLVLPIPSAVLSLLRRTGFDEPRARTLAWNAAGLAEAARRRRRGIAWRPVSLPPPGPASRAFAAAEFLLVSVGLPLGEEFVVSARAPQAAVRGSPVASSS